MAPPKSKGQKMALGEFLQDESLGSPPRTGMGSWADEMEDMPPVQNRSGAGYGNRRDYGGASLGRSDREDRYPPRQAIPPPDKPPFTAHVGNLPFEVTETQMSEFFSSCQVENVRLVRDRIDNRPKGFGYVEFETKEGLIAAVDMSGQLFCGRNVKRRIVLMTVLKETGVGVILLPLPTPHGEGVSVATVLVIVLGKAGIVVMTVLKETGVGVPLLPLADPPRRGGERGDRLGDRFGEGGDRGDRRHSYNDASERAPPREARELDWGRKTALPPPTLAASERGGRPRSGDREYRRRSPAPASEGGRGGYYRERPQIERQQTAPERNNSWRSAARPDPPAVQEPPPRSTPASPVVPHTRPKLELKPRSEHPIEPGPTSAASTGESSKANPFGAARPIDTAQREREVEERRAAAIAARKAKDDKAREEKRAREAEKQSEAGTPTGSNKNFALLRRASAGPEGEGEREKEVRVEKRDERPSKVIAGNWRAARPEPKDKDAAKGPKLDTTKASNPAATEEDTDGWTPVSGKRGRGSANGTKSLTGS
ncbi:unnamed protein product [Tuber aestivum]|uniref:RRM domain-containing protein n=1 Tax=Tuber aestivum TaxID=59557 RepID=A0A292PIU3_9PEZI|nr:unnamed protein product [Tuber aestivum]